MYSLHLPICAGTSPWTPDHLCIPGLQPQAFHCPCLLSNAWVELWGPTPSRPSPTCLYQDARAPGHLCPAPHARIRALWAPHCLHLALHTGIGLCIALHTQSSMQGHGQQSSLWVCGESCRPDDIVPGTGCGSCAGG